ncbi:MAG: hypothetical protein Q8M24_15590 [Pseudolabrys sp.]|nr:hypothetical protein [Pseudolabrys sp.]MDP2296866.1 hypothetical protein [Pseudolabrys sp.]
MPAPVPSFQNYSTDPADGLDNFMAGASDRTKDRVRRLQNHSNVIQARLDAKQKRLGKIREEIGEVDRLIATITRDEERMGPLKRNAKSDDDKGSTLVTVDRLGPLKEKRARLRAEYREVEAEVFPSAPGPNERWMAAAAVRAQFDDEELPTFKVPAKSTIKQAQEATVAAADATIARVKRVQRAPLPLGMVNDQIERIVNKIADEGEPRLGALFAGGRISERTGKFQIAVPKRQIGFAKTRVQEEFGESNGLVPDGLAFTAWCFRDEVISKLKAMAAARDNSGAMTPEQKRVALAEAQAAVVDALRLEVETNFAIEDETNSIIEWRKNIHPAILLGLAVDPAVAWDFLDDH